MPPPQPTGGTPPQLAVCHSSPVGLQAGVYFRGLCLGGCDCWPPRDHCPPYKPAGARPTRKLFFWFEGFGNQINHNTYTQGPSQSTTFLWAPRRFFLGPQDPRPWLGGSLAAPRVYKVVWLSHCFVSLARLKGLAYLGTRHGGGDCATARFFVLFVIFFVYLHSHTHHRTFSHNFNDRTILVPFCVSKESWQQFHFPFPSMLSRQSSLNCVLRKSRWPRRSPAYGPQRPLKRFSPGFNGPGHFLFFPKNL